MQLKIVCLSDTHTKHNTLSIPPCDVVIVAGDVCSRGELHELEDFSRWLKSQSHNFRKAFIIAGNHDWCFLTHRALCVDILKRELEDKVEYLEDSEFIFEGLKFYGSPWQPRFGNWAFGANRGEKLKFIWSNIPQDVDVLITHGPPHGIGDLTVGKPSIHVGCAELFSRVRELNQLKLHVFGHIHSGNGTYISEEALSAHFCNAAVCSESYSAEQFAYIFYIEKINSMTLISHNEILL